VPTRPPYPLEEDWPRLFEGTGPADYALPGAAQSGSELSGAALPAASPPQGDLSPDDLLSGAALYLDAAEAVVDVARRDWLDAEGLIRDPFETSDRWQGGTAARFACPAAIVAHRRQRPDLVEPAALALDQVTAKIGRAAAEGRPAFVPGVLDLTAKEIVVARDLLAPRVAPARLASWDERLAAIDPEVAYTFAAKRREGQRANNYEAYASVGEWLRCRAGLADTRAWIEAATRANLEWTTEHGLYRDPGDPATYDLSVRQNWCELLRYGYDGPLAGELDELMRRGGLTTLHMMSPLGWAPYGGRSSLFVHNEGMAAYIAECEARRWHGLERPDVAGAFRRAAHLAGSVAHHHYCGLEPLRNIKNSFAPSTKHGRDRTYGEYAVYSLLGASLLARAALVADDAIPVAGQGIGAQGSLLHLYPDFHRTFATCGDTQVQLDTRAQLSHDATGVGRIHRVGVPPALGLSCSVAPDASYIVSRGAGGRAAAIGPAWRCADGAWQSLAGCSEEIVDVSCQSEHVGPDAVRWTIAQQLVGCDVGRVLQRYALEPGRLHIDVELPPGTREVAVEVPCLVFDGERETSIETGADYLCVRFRGARLVARAPQADRVVLAPEERASRQAVYRVAAFERSGRRLEAEVRLERDC